ncbi:MAG: ABC transporter ATP-binding protein [Syntrophomonadaceae bacterium]|nr:ABC transporter ATP-binding protein [Syntrophomonadaceae bacterium]
MILEVNNLQKTFVNNGVCNVACNGISFYVEEHECLGLIGESGCGKSTSANMIAGLLKPDGGSIVFEGKELLTGSPRQQRLARKNMQMIFQNPQASFNPRIKLSKAIVEPLTLSGNKHSKAEIEALLDSALAAVGLKSEYKDKYAWEISGGECQRAAIARAMICKPRFLICDEITSALDVSIQAQIMHLIYDLKRSSDISYLFISHDLAVVSNLCDKVAVMYNGSIVEYGPTMEVVNHPLHPYTKDLITNALHPGENEIFQNAGDEAVQSGCAYYRFCKAAKDSCRTSCGQIDMTGEHNSRCLIRNI